MKTKNREKQFRGSKMYKLGGNRDRNFFKNSFMSLVVICFMLLFVGVGIVSAVPITFSNITVTAIKDTSVLIHWNTDVPATGQIEYGLDTTYGNLTEEKGLSYWQYFRIATLTENTTYHFRIRAKDIDGEETISGDYTFTTRTPEELEALVRAARSEGDLPKTYYVKPDGNDSNDGLSIETAWQSLIYAIRQLEPGDTLYLLNGTWTNPGRVWFDYRTVSGIPTHPIVVKAYNGTPTLDGANETATIEIEKDWIVLEGIKVINGTKEGGIWIRGSYVTVENCISGGHNWDGISASGSYNIVRNCTAYNSDMEGISLSGHDNIAEDCTVYQYPDIEPKCDYAFSSSPGWGSESFYHITYRNCKAVGRLDAEFGHGFGFTQGKDADNITIHHSIADNCTVEYAWAGLECRGDPHDILFHNCSVFHTKKENCYGGYVHSSVANILKNITYKNVVVTGVDAGFSFSSNPTNIHVKNSIAYNCKSGFGVFTTDSTVVNCVAANNEEYGIVIPGEGSSVKNSIVINNKGAGIHGWGGTPKITYTNVWNNSGYGDYKEATPGEGCISEDPLFVDPDNGDFHLKSQAGRWNGTDWVTDNETSPCIDAGDPSEKDPDGTRINMGAYGGTSEASKSPGAATGTLTGKVTDKDSGAPIEGAVIKASSHQTTTNSTGGFTITLPAGNYTLTASKTGYQSATSSATVNERATTTVNFTLTPIHADTTSPSAVMDLSTNNPTSHSITLTWTAPGDDGNTGTASEYDIRYSTSEITEENWNSATQCTGEPAPKPAGSSETFTVTGLSPNTTYYFALKTADEVPNWSPISNSPSGKTTQVAGGLVGYWKFDEGAGTTAGDSSGNNNNGTLIDNPDWVDGKIGKALEFNGSTNYVEINDSDSLDGFDEITIEAWVKPILGQRGAVVSRYLYDYNIPINERVYELTVEQGGTIEFALSSDGSSATWLESNNTVQNNEWNHIAAVSDGNTMRIYINGEQDPNTKAAPAYLHSSSYNLQIGAWEYSPNQRDTYFNGVIDEVKIYNRALSAEEIKADYKAGISPASSSISGFITYACNETGLAGATVNLSLSQPGNGNGNETPAIKSTVTDSNGSYMFISLYPGTYNITASRRGFWYNSSSVTVTGAPGSESYTLNLTLWLKGDLNNNGKPADDVDVSKMENASIGEISPDWRYDLNRNGIVADAGDLAMIKDASAGNLIVLE